MGGEKKIGRKSRILFKEKAAFHIRISYPILSSCFVLIFDVHILYSYFMPVFHICIPYPYSPTAVSGAEAVLYETRAFGGYTL
jgi:hypothetical protein